ncbi:MAG: helix-turn-helix domain-containing protein, partial [Bacteroidota bacterium]
AKQNQQTKIKALRYGIDDYLTKPFDEEELGVRIHNLLLHAKGRNIANHSTDDSLTKTPSSANEFKWLEEVEQYIIQNISSDLLSVNKLSKVFNMSESTLLRQLKRITGLTPNKYIQEIRLNHAKALLLAQTYRTISEVAHHVGYRNAQAFSRSFKLRFGKTPAEVG